VQLNAHKDSIAFNEPINIIRLGIPDYFYYIKRPMDLGTVKNNLREGKYSDMLEFAQVLILCTHGILISISCFQDVRLTYNNAMTYNPKGHIVHSSAAAHLKEFETLICDLICERVGEVYNIASQSTEINAFLSQVIDTRHSKEVDNKCCPFAVHPASSGCFGTASTYKHI
jgi:hypothetical protein